jgi:aspartate racemase
MKNNSVYSLSIFKTNNRPNIIVPLKLNYQAKQNVFFIHPVGGTVFNYFEIAKQLNPSYNYYGIQNVNINGELLINLKTLEELAESYVGEVSRVQPEGSYSFVGWSLGGTIAYEMSRQLIALDKKINFVAILDENANIGDFLNQAGHREYLDALLKAEAEDYAYMLYGENVGTSQMEALIKARLSLMQLLLDYVPKKNNVALHLFKAMTLDEFHTKIDLPDYGWQQYIDSQINIYPIEGDHNTIMLSPGRDKIISILNNILIQYDLDIIT